MSGRVTGVLNAMGFHLGQDQRAQIVALDDEFHAMELEITDLKAQKLHLEAQVNPLQREVDGLKKQLQLKSGLHLNETETEILKFMCKVQKMMYAGEVAKGLGTNEIRVRAFLKSLMERGLVRETAHWQGGTIVGLSDDGMTYAVEQGWA